jgi:hypothetical protein
MQESSSSNWEPLPPRRKKTRHDNISGTAPSSGDIAATITARSELKTEEAKLEDKDGCSGEFYEC